MAMPQSARETKGKVKYSEIDSSRGIIRIKP